MKNRWYDSEPILSLAISLLKNNKTDVVQICIDYILKTAKENNLQLNLNFIESLKLNLQRKYDKECFMLEALEYLKIAPHKLQKEIALKIIDIIQETEQKK